jgi:hypothetical protein
MDFSVSDYYKLILKRKNDIVEAGLRRENSRNPFLTGFKLWSLGCAIATPTTGLCPCPLQVDFDWWHWLVCRFLELCSSFSDAEIDIWCILFRLCFLWSMDTFGAEINRLYSMLVVPSCTLGYVKWTSRFTCVNCQFCIIT